MPLEIKPPRNPKTQNLYIRGTHLGVTVDRSAKTTSRKTAQKVLVALREAIERGEFGRPGEPDFVSLATNYIEATGKDRFVKPLVEHFNTTPQSQITQQAIDAAALVLYPDATPATRNRQVHTVVSAILKQGGIDRAINRPKGSQGQKRLEWLTKEQAFALFKAADANDAEFGLFVRTITYTGLRLGEATGMEIAKLDLATGFVFIRKTKNGDPRGVHLPPAIVTRMKSHLAELERQAKAIEEKTGKRLERRKRVFRFHKGSALYDRLDAAMAAAGIVLPPRLGFHVLRHTWATWMRQFAGLDTRGLVGTGAWNDQASASRYAHVVASDEAKKANLLPVEPLELIATPQAESTGT